LLQEKILQKLYKKYKLGIVTGRPKEEAFFTLKKAGVRDYFDAIVTMEDVPKGMEKPDSYGIKLALSRLGRCYNNAIYFGDSIDDMKAAKNAGIEAIGVSPLQVVSPNLNLLLKKEGDKAVKRYTEKFDKIKLEKLEVSKEEIKKAYEGADDETLETLKKAAQNIRFFARKQKNFFRDFETKKDGILLGQKVIPIKKVGCYVPGGLYPLPSSALMSIIPAKVAGVKEVIVCSPKIKPVTIIAADIAGADKIFSIGGVQAIGAMAYGTSSVPKVNKIVGPGNIYVNLAKKEVYSEVGIDFIAGPSEILIIADETSNAKFIALDLLAQAEHSKDSKINLITNSGKIGEEVNKEIKLQLKALKTKEVAKLSLENLKNGKIIIVKNLKKAVKIANKMAPEHLELQVKNPRRLMKKLRNYGSLFIGKFSGVIFGDYCSGVNHILPTNGAAKYTGGLSVKDFLKIVTYQKISKVGARKMVQIASKFSDIEGLEAHKKSAEVRI
jgi:histidinol dehydrogenase